MDLSDRHYLSVVFLHNLMPNAALFEDLHKCVLAYSNPKTQNLQGREMHNLCFISMSTEDTEKWHAWKVIRS